MTAHQDHDDGLLRVASHLFRLAAWAIDVRRGTLQWSAAMFDIHELEGPAPPGLREALAYFPEDVRPRVAAVVERSMDEGTSFDIEVPLVTAQGRRIWVRMIGVPVHDADGRIARIHGALRDVSAERSTRERLTEQAVLLEAARDAIIVLDTDGRITYWTGGAEKTYGWTSREATGQRLEDLLFVQAADPAIAEALDTTGAWQGLMTHATRDGGERRVDTSWSVVRDDERTRTSVLIIGTDVTSRQKLEQQMMRAQRLESIGTLAGGIAHDLNNVLTPIMMSLELLRDRVSDAPGEKLLETLQASVQRGAEMVAQVLSFARGVDSEQVEVRLEEVLGDVQKLLRDTLPKDIQFSCVVSPELWTVQADSTQVHQVLMNLCVNARDAMAQGGRLTATLDNVVVDEVYAGLNPGATPGPYVLLQVEDTGTGIPSDVQERIFEPFFTTKDVGRGTGLGLSTTLAIVRGHGGFINLYSEVGKGTRFKVYLPANVSRAAAAQTFRRQSHLPSGNGELLLLADDEEGVRVVARKTLERFGYRVLLAQHGADAVGLYAKHRDEIALVITDMMMPVMDGPATIAALQTIDPDVRIVGSSGLHSNALVARAIQAGVTHFVSKPYTADALLRVLHDALHPGEPEALPPLQA